LHKQIQRNLVSVHPPPLTPPTRGGGKTYPPHVPLTEGDKGGGGRSGGGAELLRNLKTHTQEGFSLIEIIIVMVIIGALAGTAIPVYIGMGPSIRLSGATRQIMGDLMWARMQAISQNNEYKVFFLDDHRYQILDDTDNDGNIDSGESTITKDIQEKYDGVTFTSNNNPIFHPRGNASNLATITLTNSFGTKQVKIAITGRVKIE